jgi:hypothetical protein
MGAAHAGPNGRAVYALSEESEMEALQKNTTPQDRKVSHLTLKALKRAE